MQPQQGLPQQYPGYGYPGYPQQPMAYPGYPAAGAPGWPPQQYPGYYPPAAVPGYAAPATDTNAPQPALDEQPDYSNTGFVEMKSTNAHYNMNEILGQNIVNSEYYKSLAGYTTFQDFIQEICNEVTHLEPFVIGKQRLPSTAFSIIYKFCTMHLTTKQVHSLLQHKNAMVRGIGFLFLRYVADPEKLWEWYEPYVDDPQQFAPGGSDKNTKITMGQYVRNLMTENQYYGTIFKRLPLKLARDLQKMFLAREMKKSQAGESEKYRDLIESGLKCMAQYEDGKFYDCVIEKVMPNGNFYVTYTEYGNQEEVGIDKLLLPDRITKEGDSRRNKSKSKGRRSSRSRSRDRDRGRETKDRGKGRSRSRSRERDRDRDGKSNTSSSSSSRRSRSRSRSGGRRRSRSRSRGRRRSRSRSNDRDKSPGRKLREMEEELMKKEREKAVASGKDYAKRPASYKTALSMKLSVATGRKRSKSPPAARRSYRESSSSSSYRDDSPPRKKDNAEAQARLAQLKAVYGDASSKKKGGDGDKGADGGSGVIML